MAISTSPIPTTPAELDAIKRRLQDPTIDISKLQQYATGSVATIPGYLALGELSRRNSLIQNQQAQNANPAPPTILQQQAQQAQAPQAPQQGIAQGMPPGAPPPQGGQMPPQAPPQMPQMPPKPVAAANGGLMQLPMRPDMFRRSDYAHGGVVHFAGGGDRGDTFVEDLSGGSSEALVEDQLRVEAAAKNEKDKKAREKYEFLLQASPALAANVAKENPSVLVKPPSALPSSPPAPDLNAGIKQLNDISGGGGGEGGGGGINKETAKLAGPALKYINEYLKSEDPARITKGDYLEGKREQQLDVLPRTNTSRLEEIQQSYNRPRTWDENLSLMKQDALRARSGAGFSDTDIGGAARSLDASNREKSIAISLKLEEIENLDRKAQFAHKNGQDDEATKIEIERDKLIAEVKKLKGTVAGQAVQGIAGLARMPNVGAGVGKGTGISAELILKTEKEIDDFLSNPVANNTYWKYVKDPTGNLRKTLTDKSMKDTNSYKNALKLLQEQAPEINDRVQNRLGTGKAITYPKTKPAG